jgi:F-type H+-transporting ATPase subunit delta
MQNPRLAARYAKSLLDLAKDQNQLEATLKDIQLLNAICQQSTEFGNMLKSPIINADKKGKIITAVLNNRLSPLVKSFVDLLVRKGRESVLPQVARAFISQYQELKNIKTVKITTAAPVSDKVKEIIRNRVIASLPNNAIELKEAVDPDLIGGFVLEMDDKLFDASIRRDLNDVKAQFLKNLYVSELR